MGMRKKIVPLAMASALALSLAACGGGGSSSGGGGQQNSDAAANMEGRGPITYVQGKDTPGIVPGMVKRWNEAHPNEKVTFREQSDNADQQHDDLVQNFQTKNANYDIVSVDVIWTAEFAAKGWLQPLKDSMALDTSKMIPSTVKAATYSNTLYAAPMSSDGGILWYRKDLVPTPPKTWDEMMGMCDVAKKNSIGCYAGQFAKYEGLTVNASEAINSQGGHVLNDEGKPDVNTDQAKAGLQALADAYKNGDIPKDAITYQEEQGRSAFQSGKLLFLRNWPYVYTQLEGKASSVAGKVGMAPLPGKDGTGASTLGGHSAAVSVYSKHKATAKDFLAFVTSESEQKQYALDGSQAPVLASLYDDATLTKQLPYLPTLKESIENAVPRPVTPFYPAVTKAIQDNAYAALKGEKSVDSAVSDMQQALTAATSGSQ